MLRTTTTSYHRLGISWVVLVLLSTLNIVAVVRGDKINGAHVLHDTDSLHGQGQVEHHHSAASDEDHSHVVKTSSVNRHDHSEHEYSEHDHTEHDHPDHDHSENENSGHIHGESCNHDHDEAAAATDSPSPDSVSQDHHGHDHSHSHSHSHDHRPRRPPPKFTPLMESIRDDKYDTFQKLISDPSVDIGHFQKDWPISALFYTFVLRKYNYTEELLGNGVDVKAKTDEGLCAMMLALKTIDDDKVKFRIVNMLVDSGAEVDSDHLEDYNKLMQLKGRETNNNAEEEGNVKESGADFGKVEEKDRQTRNTKDEL